MIGIFTTQAIKLGAIRQQRHLSLREVEQRSLHFAAEWGDQSYRISASWLNRLERQEHELTVNKLMVLAHIYNVSPERLLPCRDSGDSQSKHLTQLCNPDVPMRLIEGAPEQQVSYLPPNVLGPDHPPDETTLCGVEKGSLDAPYLRAIIGKRDGALNPMIPPGSMVQIDTGKRAIMTRAQRMHEIQRPIYFLMTRDAYVCGWCELDEDLDWLTLVPHPLSSAPSRRWKYPGNIESVGRVTAVAIPFTR